MADKAKLLKTAQKHLSKGSVDRAIITFQKLVEVDPRDQRLLLRLAELQARVGRKKEAIQNYEKIASVYIKQDFTPKAIAVYKTILRLDPEQLAAYEKLTELYKNQGLEAEALSQLENLFAVYEKRNDESKQIEVLKIMIEMDHENLGFQVRLGETLARKGMKQEAAGAFAKAATTLSRRGFHDRASQLFEKIIGLNPDNVDVRRELCSHYLESGQFQEARRETEAIIDLEPDDPRMVLLLGRILFQLGRKREAEENIARSIELFQKTGELGSVVKEYLFVAQSHLRQEELDEAEIFYQHVLKTLPDETKAIKGLVSVAEARTDRIAQITNLLLLGRALMRKGDEKGASRAIEKVLELDPLNEEAKDLAASGVSPGGEFSAEDLEDEPEVLQVEDLELEDLEAELEDVGGVELLEGPGIEMEQGPEGIEKRGETSLEHLEEPGDLVHGEMRPQDASEEQEAFEEQEILDEDQLPDIVLEDFGDETVVEFEAVLEEGPVVEGVGPEEEEDKIIDDLLAEAEVYKRYGLKEKLEETMHRISSLAPHTPDILEKIELLSHEPDEPGDFSTMDAVQGLDPLIAENVSTVEQETEHDAAQEEPFKEDLEEAEFYLSQGLEDEALRIYRSIIKRSPEHPVASEAIARSGQVIPARKTDSEAPRDESRLEVEKVQYDSPSARELKSKLIVEDSAAEEAGGFLDLADELRSELSEEFYNEIEPEPQDETATFEEIFAQFKRGIEETLGDEEYETHYNLGIAYKDMGLFDDALREFEIGSRDPDLTQDSLSLMAMCFFEKKDFDSAVKAVQKAMEISDEGARAGLYFQLGEIHEREKDWQGALAAYSEVQSRDPSFEGIDAILERVRSHTDATVPEEVKELPVEGGMDDMLSDLIKEVEEMARENAGEPGGEPGKTKKDRISYL